LPYIYSLAWKTTSEAYTPMRALVMDFPADRNALDIPDQFMFGPALLVNPVTKPGATSRTLYLPAGTTWYDFWTGASLKGGQIITAAAPLEIMPLYVRAGSIIPMGPELQYANEQRFSSIEVRIYPGADGEFTLYEDDGATYAYEKGAYAAITLRWSDAAHTLTISAQAGSFPGMLQKRTFNVVLVSSKHGVGEEITHPDQVVNYNGAATTARLSTPRN